MYSYYYLRHYQFTLTKPTNVHKCIDDKTFCNLKQGRTVTAEDAVDSVAASAGR